jgi:cell wall-associated NlpC family hydrolase
MGLLVAGCQTSGTSNPGHSNGPTEDLRSGDIVFQDSSPNSGQAAPIKALTRSRWSHCGIYFNQGNGEGVVVDGNGSQGPISWAAWRARGEGQRFAAYQLAAGLSDAQSRSLWTAALSYDRRPYDLKFAWDRAKIYCSELIWKAYRDALGMEIGRLQRLQDFDLRSPAARELIERPGSWGSVAAAEANGDEPVISPQAILESPLLVRVR